MPFRFNLIKRNKGHVRRVGRKSFWSEEILVEACNNIAFNNVFVYMQPSGYYTYLLCNALCYQFQIKLVFTVTLPANGFLFKCSLNPTTSSGLVPLHSFFLFVWFFFKKNGGGGGHSY